MKIVCIFTDRLFAFQYKGAELNELRKLLNMWNDTAYLFKFVKENKSDAPQNMSIKILVSQLIENANEIDDILSKISNDHNRKLEEFFKPLDNQEYREVSLSKQKGRKRFLRIYAIKIDDNCFVITGGAIKFHHLMEDRPHTLMELKKINKCRDYLKKNNVFDYDSFFEFLNEEL